MAGGNASPRQKMINMMYLVLTALLAMNVSADILNAFTIVNNGIVESNDVMEKSTGKKFTDFIAFSNKPEGADAKPYANKAQQMRDKCKKLYDDLEKFKEEIIAKSGGYVDPEKTELKGKDNLDVGTFIMIEQKNGDKLEKQINSTRDEILKMVTKESDRKSLESAITMRAEMPHSSGKGGHGGGGHGGEAATWATSTFGHVPVIGCITILSKLQNDVKSTEAKMLDYFINQVTAEQFHFDKLSARVIAPKSYLSSGKEYTADIFLAASSTQIQPEVYVGSLNWSKFTKDSMATLPADQVPFNGTPSKVDVQGGMGKFTETASGVGAKSHEGAIKIKNPKGLGFDWYAFHFDYEVAPPGGFSVAATKMNVMYIGVPNPISISASGAKSDNDISASITGGSISRAGKDGWVATVNTPGEETVTVSGKTVEGDQKTFGQAKFRVKRIPDPKATLGGKDLNSKIQKGTLTAQGGLVPLLEGFDFDCKFQVTEYTLIYAPSGQDIVNKNVQGPVIGPDVKAVLGRVRPKDVVIFDNIKARGCDGTTRKLGSLTFTII